MTKVVGLTEKVIVVDNEPDATVRRRGEVINKAVETGTDCGELELACRGDASDSSAVSKPD